MGFGDQIQKFGDGVMAQLDVKKKEAQVNAEERLRELLGEDVALIKSSSLDLDVGKFYAVDAPEAVIARIRAAGLLRD
jgi:hypothetical protein